MGLQHGICHVLYGQLLSCMLGSGACTLSLHAQKLSACCSACRRMLSAAVLTAVGVW